MLEDVTIPDFTLEGLMVAFLILYTALQFADPIFIIFQFFADMLLYIVMIVIAVIAAYVVAMVIHSMGETAIEMIKEAWQNYREPEFEWIEIEELEE